MPGVQKMRPRKPPETRRGGRQDGLPGHFEQRPQMLALALAESRDLRFRLTGRSEENDVEVRLHDNSPRCADGKLEVLRRSHQVSAGFGHGEAGRSAAVLAELHSAQGQQPQAQELDQQGFPGFLKLLGRRVRDKIPADPEISILVDAADRRQRIVPFPVVIEKVPQSHKYIRVQTGKGSRQSGGYLAELRFGRISDDVPGQGDGPVPKRRLGLFEFSAQPVENRLETILSPQTQPTRSGFGHLHAIVLTARPLSR